MKKFLTLILISILLLNSAISQYAAEQPTRTITVKVDGQVVVFPDAQPYIDENNRTLVPIRFISEALGADVAWNDEMKLVMLAKDITRIALFIGQNQATINTPEGGDKVVTFDTKAVIKQDRTMVPLRFVSEGMGATVTWDPDTYTVDIKTVKALALEYMEPHILMQKMIEWERDGNFEEAYKHLDVSFTNNGAWTVEDYKAHPELWVSRSFTFYQNKYPDHKFYVAFKFAQQLSDNESMMAYGIYDGAIVDEKGNDAPYDANAKKIIKRDGIWYLDLWNTTKSNMYAFDYVDRIQ